MNVDRSAAPSRDYEHWHEVSALLFLSRPARSASGRRCHLKRSRPPRCSSGAAILPLLSTRKRSGRVPGEYGCSASQRVLTICLTCNSYTGLASWLCLSSVPPTVHAISLTLPLIIYPSGRSHTNRFTNRMCAHVHLAAHAPHPLVRGDKIRHTSVHKLVSTPNFFAQVRVLLGDGEAVDPTEAFVC